MVIPESLIKIRMAGRFSGLLIAITCLLFSASSRADAPPPIFRLEVYPLASVLDGPHARTQYIVTGYTQEGMPVDLTDRATFRPLRPNWLDVKPGGLALPIHNGRGEIEVLAGGKRMTVDLGVMGMEKRSSWSFENHVESVLSKQGCNAGTCHGAGSGKGGFKLTLRAYDPDLDYTRLCREGLGRRVIRSAPEKSLLLRKPSLAMAHVGGLRLRPDSLEYKVLADWISAGAPGPKPTTPRLLRLFVYPNERVLLPSASQRLSVLAHFSDGQFEDVTNWARYSSNEETIAKVDDAGRVQMVGRGETAITVWYLGKVAFSRLAVPYPNTVDLRSNYLLPKASYIDKLVYSKLAQLHLTPSSRSTDSEFCRRVYLDAIGCLPSPAETRSFLLDHDPGKRSRLIDSLLERPEYVDYWTYKLCDILRVNRDILGDKGMWGFYTWIRERVAENAPWDQTVHEILTAQGNSAQFGPANFYRMGAKPEEFAETVSQAFLGIRVQCAKCHNHPFEKWTQSDYFRMANFFSRTKVKTDKPEGGALVFASQKGDVNHPKLGRPLPPAAFDGPMLALDAPGDRRTFLADWMISPNNPYFARSIVNRVWKHYMGRGLVEPVDDMRLTNPASNEPLLDALTKDFFSHSFDLKRLARIVLCSNSYQASSRPNSTNSADDRYYSRYIVRRLAAEPLLDCVCQVTDQPEKFGGIPKGARATSLPDTRVSSSFLDIFGRPERQVTCDCERNMEPNVAQALHMISATTLNSKVNAKGGIVDKLLETGKPDSAIIEELYLRALCRHSSQKERDSIMAQLLGKKAEVRRQVFVDLLWALLSGPEFVFNH